MIRITVDCAVDSSDVGAAQDYVDGFVGRLSELGQVHVYASAATKPLDPDEATEQMLQGYRGEPGGR